MNYFKIILSHIFICTLLFNGIVYGQEGNDSTAVQNYEPSLTFSHLKNTADSRILICDIKVKKNNQFLPIENAEIFFYAGVDSQIELGKAKSNKQGRARLELKPDVDVAMNDTGTINFAAEYKGGENSSEAREILEITDMSIEMTLDVVDSVKTITLKATRFGKNKEIKPLGDMEINVYVKRLYSDLVIGKVYLDPETGEGSVEFPTIPGDSVGDVNIIARVNEDELFGTVEKRETKKWGTPVVYKYNRIGPALWSEHAPIWMTITLYIFLAGVWYHLILVFRRMFKVKKLGKEMNQSNML